MSILGRSIFAAELARILVAPGVVDPAQAYHITGHANGVKSILWWTRGSSQSYP